MIYNDFKQRKADESKLNYMICDYGLNLYLFITNISLTATKS